MQTFLKILVKHIWNLWHFWQLFVYIYITANHELWNWIWSSRFTCKRTFRTIFIFLNLSFKQGHPTNLIYPTSVLREIQLARKFSEYIDYQLSIISIIWCTQWSIPAKVYSRKVPCWLANSDSKIAIYSWIFPARNLYELKSCINWCCIPKLL